MTPMSQYTQYEKKANGVFYTPTFLANYLAKKIIQYSKGSEILSVLDPACGDSQLLRAFAAQVNSNPLFVGVDNDINAIATSQNLFTKENTRLYNTDGLFPTNGICSIVSWKALREDAQCDKGFNVVLSNPPWGAELKGYTPQLLYKNFDLAKGQFDIYDLFVEVVLRNLTSNGQYGLILPDSLFTQEQARLRKLLTTTTTINLIARLGEKIFPEINRACVLVVGTKGAPISNHLVDCFRLSPAYKKDIIGSKRTLENAEQELKHQVPQSRFANNDSNVFDIDLKVDEQITYYKIQKASIPLIQIVSNTRGAEISKRGKACFCPHCKNWFPYPKAKQPNCLHCKEQINVSAVISERIVAPNGGLGYIRLKAGEDLFRYKSHFKNWIDVTKVGINYKNLAIYQGAKILVRKTGVGITASLDYDNAITTQVVYILNLRPALNNILTIEFVLAVLNSRAISYFLLKKFGENEWKSHPYLTQKMLVDLPFPKDALSMRSLKPLIEEVTNLVRKEVLSDEKRSILKDSDIKLERVIAKCFGLTKTDYVAIFDTLHAAQPLIPIRRLLDCSLTDIFPAYGI